MNLRTNLRLTILLLTTMLVASAQAADVTILFDVDHNPNTGCNVPTIARTKPDVDQVITVHGVDVIVITSWDLMTRKVTSVSQKRCLGNNLFGDPDASCSRRASGERTDSTTGRQNKGHRSSKVIRRNRNRLSSFAKVAFLSSPDASCVRPESALLLVDWLQGSKQ